MDDLTAIVGSDHATGRYAQGSRNMATSSSRIQRDLNDAWTKLDDDTNVSIDLSEDHLGDSTGNYDFSNDSHRATENCSFCSTPNRATDSKSSCGGSASTKRMRFARPCDFLSSSLNGVAGAMRNFGLGKEVNHASKVLDIFKEVQGLTNTEFIEVGQMLTRDKQLASFFVSLRRERRADWLKKTLFDLNGGTGGGSS